VDDTEALEQLHGEAEAAIESAMAATRAAGELAAGMDPPMRDAFEYGEANRSLRAALTALRSALIEVQDRERGRAESA